MATRSGLKSGTPRMADIAKAAGVSRMAVSAVLMGTGNGRIRVSSETAERIQKIAQEFDYRPNPAAQHLAGKRSGVIAIVAKDWRNFLTQSALTWLHEAAEEQGFRVLTAQGGSSSPAIDHVIRDLRSGWVDGMVYLAYQNETQWKEMEGILKNLKNAAVVAVGDLRVPGVPAVISDVAAGAKATMLHLAERGRRRPVFVTEEIETPSTLARLEAYRESAKTCGITFDDDSVIVEGLNWLIGDSRFYPQFDELARRIYQGMRADAIICDSDFTAAALMQSCGRMGIKVPDLLSIVGWGNLQFANATFPTLTTVSYELGALLTRVVAWLKKSTQDDFDSADLSELVEYVEPRLIVRESS